MRSLSLLPNFLVRKVSESCVSSLGEEATAALAAISKRSSRLLVRVYLLRHLEEQDAAQHAQESEKTKAAHEITSGMYRALVASPPCSTFSRCRSSAGPRPLRSRRWPRGFPWLTPRALQSVKDANILINFTEQALRAQSDTSDPNFILEHPEDLERWKTGSNPASTWQWNNFRDLAELNEVKTGALRQSDWETDYQKSTRLLVRRQGGQSLTRTTGTRDR